MAVVAVKPVPVTVNVVAGAPAVTDVGEIEVTVGGITGGVVPPPPEFEEPPQPLRMASTKGPRSKNERRSLHVMKVEPI